MGGTLCALTSPTSLLLMYQWPVLTDFIVLIVPIPPAWFMRSLSVKHNINDIKPTTLLQKLGLLVTQGMKLDDVSNSRRGKLSITPTHVYRM